MDQPPAPAPAPAPAPDQGPASFSAAIRTTTWLILLAGAALAVVIGILGREPGINSSYFVGTLTGRALGVVIFSLAGGWIAFLVSKRNVTATNTTAIVVAVLAVAGGAMNLGKEINERVTEQNSENAKIIKEMGEEVGALKGELRVLFNSGEDLGSPATSALQKKISERIRHHAGRLDGNLGEFMAGFLVFQTTVEEASAGYQAALAPIGEADYFNLSAVKTPADLDDRIATAEKFKKEVEVLRKAFESFQEIRKMESMLKLRGEKEFAGGMLGQFAAMSRDMEEMRNLDAEYADRMIEAFVLVKEQWDAVPREGFLQDLEFEDEEANARLDKIFTRMAEIEERQTKLQNRLLR